MCVRLFELLKRRDHRRHIRKPLVLNALRTQPHRHSTDHHRAAHGCPQLGTPSGFNPVPPHRQQLSLRLREHQRSIRARALRCWLRPPTLQGQAFSKLRAHDPLERGHQPTQFVVQPLEHDPFLQHVDNQRPAQQHDDDDAGVPRSESGSNRAVHGWDDADSM